MQRNYYTDDFEQLIRQKADQYKMYPSDHVWKGVHKALHGRRRWYWAGTAVLLLGAGNFSASYLLKEQTVNQLAKQMQPHLLLLKWQIRNQSFPIGRNTSGEILSNSSPERVTEREPFLTTESSLERSLPLHINDNSQVNNSNIDRSAFLNGLKGSTN
jgi:hypothetical protein